MFCQAPDDDSQIQSLQTPGYHPVSLTATPEYDTPVVSSSYSIFILTHARLFPQLQHPYVQALYVAVISLS